jgi:hypothetical protein
MKLGIITLQRQPPDPLSWIRYHVEVGIKSFYMWLEDSDALKPQLEAYAAKLTREGKGPVHMHAELASAFNRSAEDNYSDLQSRQQAFINRMIAQARQDKVDWVFHVDDDELLHPRSSSTWPEVLKKVDASCDSVHMKNWEGYSPEQPSGSWITDKNVQYMPGDCAHFFAAYANGKSASRTKEGQQAWGPHHFTGGKECELDEKEGVVLHHDSLAMSPDDVPPKAYIEKNRLRITSDMSRIPFPFTHKSVDAVKNDDMQALGSVWHEYRSQGGDKFKQCTVSKSVFLPSHKW